MKHIAVLYTGGTIGSYEEQGRIDVGVQPKRVLIRHFEQHSPLAPLVKFTQWEPLRILSEDLTPAHWGTLAYEIAQIPADEYDGLIITHGTDTLAYTAAMLSILLRGMRIPTVLVSSGYVLTSPRANGHQNFEDAVRLILSGVRGGVYAPFADADGHSRLFDARTLTQCSAYTDDFAACDGRLAGTFSGDRFVPTHELTGQPTGLEACPSFDAHVLCLKPYPGLDYAAISLDDVDAVLHGLYHSATACTDVGRYSLLEFIDRCRERGIPVYGAPSFRDPAEGAYETTLLLKEHGLTVLAGCSWERAYAAVLLAAGSHGRVSPEKLLT